MTSVLFVTWDGGGNVPPALRIAHELVARGAGVRFLGHESQRLAVESEGFAFEAYRSARPWSAVSRHSAARAPLAYAAVFTDRGIGRDLLESLEREPVERLVIDGLLIGALDAAARGGYRYIVLVHTLRDVMIRLLTRGPLALIMGLKRLRPSRLYAAAESEIVAALASIDAGAVEAPPAAVYVGPLIPSVEASAVSSAPPAVLVSLSTTYIKGQRELIQTLLDALADRDVRVIVTTGPAVEPGELRAPANAELHRVVPHREIMPWASLVIGHGGHATTMLALAHGVPLLVIPMNPSFDQPVIGRIVAEQGAGLTLSRRARTTEVRKAIDELLSSPAYRENAERIGALIRQTRPDQVAADVVLRAPAIQRE